MGVKEKRKGISLIILIITIIVIIILAGAVILSLSKNNPIESAKKATFLNDLEAFKNELLLYKAKQYGNELGQYNPEELYADDNSLTYKGQVQQDGNITTLIPSLDNEDKYKGKFEVIEGELWYVGNDKNEQKWAEENGVQVNNEKPKVVVSTLQSLPVKSGIDVKYMVRFTSSQAIISADLTGKIKVIDSTGNEITNQPTIEIGELSGTNEDKSRTIEVTIKTTTLSEGVYKLKVGAGVVQNNGGGTNEEEVVSINAFEIDNEAPQMPIITTDPENLENWVSGIVKITLTSSESGNKLEYNLDGSTNYIEYTGPIEINENKTIYAKETDKANNASNIATLQITKIDNIVPQNAVINASNIDDKVNATITLVDNQSGINITNSKYIVTTQLNEYGLDNSIWNSATSLTSNPQTVEKSGLSDGDYYVHVLSVDKVGNKRENISSKVTLINSAIDDPGYIAGKGVNGPILKEGMTPIKWDVSGNIVTTTKSDTDWYDYTNKKWANAQTADGSIWVWIPRYEYKIPTPHSSNAQTIAINFLQGVQTTPTSGYTVHPAFTFGSTQLKGIWVAKFEASGSTNAVDIKPNVIPLRGLTISDAYTISRNMETNSRYGWGTSGVGIDTHLIKNIEWGAVAYLSSSPYGKSGEVWINPYYDISTNSEKTGQAGTGPSVGNTTSTYTYNNSSYGINASTSGTVYGIYDMSGGLWEYTAAYVDNANQYLTVYGATLTSSGVDAKYKDVYTVTNDNQSDNYANSSNKKGDAVYETSTSTAGPYTNAWYGDYSFMPFSGNPFFQRGGDRDEETIAGIFSFGLNMGSANWDLSFRPVLVLGSGI